MSQFLAIDADARGLVVVAAEVRGGAVRVHAAARLADAPPLTMATAPALGAALRARLKADGIKPAPVLLTVGRDRLVLKTVRHPPAPPAEEPAVVRFQAVKELTESPDDVVMDYTPLPPAESGERRAAVVFLRKDVMAAARALCEAAGLKLAGVAPRPFAAAALLKPAAGPDAVALLGLWPGGGEFTVARAGDVLFTRAVPAAAADDDRMLAAELKRNLTVYASQNPGQPVGAVHVAGDPARADRLAGVLSVPVHPLDPLAGGPAGIAPEFRGQFVGPAGAHAAMAAGGLAINFAAPRQPRAAASPNRPRMLVGAGLGVLAVAVAAVVAFLAIDRADQRLAAATAERDQLDRQLEQFEPDAKRLAAADEFAGREVVWLDELYDLADRFPDYQKMRLVELEATATNPPRPAAKPPGGPAAAPVKGAKPTPVAAMRLVLATDEPILVDRLVDAVNRDGYYTGTGKTIAGLASSTAKLQQFSLNTQIIHRGPAEYRRKLPPAPPPPAPAATAPAEAGAGFDGGFDFGGFGP